MEAPLHCVSEFLSPETAIHDFGDFMGYHAPVSRVGRQLGMARTWLSERVERRIYLFPSPPLSVHYILATLRDLYFIPKERVRKSQSAFKLFPMHREELGLLNIFRLDHTLFAFLWHH